MSRWQISRPFLLLFIIVAMTSLITLVLTPLVSWLTRTPNIPASQAGAEGASTTASTENQTPASTTLPVKQPTESRSEVSPSDTFVYSFNTPGILNEAATAAESTSPYWFLDSGGELIVGNSVGETIQGSLPSDSRWRLAYVASNPVDTDDGYHPQNIFRLVTKSSWNNASMQTSFMINADNFSASPNRNESNGLLLMSRYQSHDTLYYAGIRVDGTAVIKKKYDGTYYTMAQVPIFPGVYSAADADLLPHGEWITLKATTVTNTDGSVSVTLYMQRNGAWSELLTARDNGLFGNTPPITASGLDGIRTDFMDVAFQNVRITSL